MSVPHSGQASFQTRRQRIAIRTGIRIQPHLLGSVNPSQTTTRIDKKIASALMIDKSIHQHRQAIARTAKHRAMHARTNLVINSAQRSIIAVTQRQLRQNWTGSPNCCQAIIGMHGRTTSHHGAEDRQAALWANRACEYHKHKRRLLARGVRPDRSQDARWAVNALAILTKRSTAFGQKDDRPLG